MKTLETGHLLPTGHVVSWNISLDELRTNPSSLNPFPGKGEPYFVPDFQQRGYSHNGYVAYLSEPPVGNVHGNTRVYRGGVPYWASITSEQSKTERHVPQRLSHVNGVYPRWFSLDQMFAGPLADNILNKDLTYYNVFHPEGYVSIEHKIAEKMGKVDKVDHESSWSYHWERYAQAYKLANDASSWRRALEVAQGGSSTHEVHVDSRSHAILMTLDSCLKHEMALSSVTNGGDDWGMIFENANRDGRVYYRDFPSDSWVGHLTDVVWKTIERRSLLTAKEQEFGSNRTAQTILELLIMRVDSEIDEMRDGLRRAHLEDPNYKLRPVWNLAVDGWKKVLPLSLTRDLTSFGIQ